MSFITALSRDYSLAQVSEARMIKMMAATTEEDALSMGFLDKLFDSLLRSGKKYNTHAELWQNMSVYNNPGCWDAMHFDPKLAEKSAKGYLHDSQVARIYQMQTAIELAMPPTSVGEAEKKPIHQFVVSLTPVTVEPLQPKDGYLLTVKLNNKLLIEPFTVPCPPKNTPKNSIEGGDRRRFIKTAAYVFALQVKYSRDTMTDESVREFIEQIGGIGDLKDSSVSLILEMVKIDDSTTLKEHVNRIAAK